MQNNVPKNKVVRTDPANPNFIELYKKLDVFLAEINGASNDFFHAFNKPEGLNVVVAYRNESAVGCGAFKPYSKGVVEIKRMFLLPEHRGTGLAKAILGELEAWARQAGNTHSILETSVKLPAAIQFYRNNGYIETEKYDPYVDSIESICFKKKL